MALWSKNLPHGSEGSCTIPNLLIATSMVQTGSFPHWKWEQTEIRSGSDYMHLNDNGLKAYIQYTFIIFVKFTKQKRFQFTIKLDFIPNTFYVMAHKIIAKFWKID
jgi:hypothetical protein